MKTKHMAGKIIALTFIVLLGTLLCLALYYYSENRLNYDVVNLIHDRQKRAGEFIDMDGQVQVDSVDDLGFILKEGKIELHYGVQTIDIPFNSLDNEEWLNALGDIGIKVYRRYNEKTEETEYRVTYWDEVITEWSKVY